MSQDTARGTLQSSSEALIRELSTHALHVIEGKEPKPVVLVVEGRYGCGKTYAVQRLFDMLSSVDPNGYWRPGLTPTVPSRSEDALMTSRKRVSDSNLCNPLAPPSWLWIGVPCGATAGSEILGDPVLGAVQFQLSRHIRIIESHGGLLGALRQRVSSISSEIGSASSTTVADYLAGGLPIGTAALTLFRVAKEVVASFGEARASLDEIEGEQVAKAHDTMARFVETISAGGVTTLVVLDDAHRCTSSTLRLLARAITGQDAERPKRFFASNAAPQSRRLVIVATAWPEVETPGDFWTWIDELRDTDVGVHTFAESKGWLPPIDEERARTTLSALVPALSGDAVRKIVAAGARDHAINPLLLMRYATFALESDADARTNIEEWLLSIPTSLEDIQRRRFDALGTGAQEAARIAVSLGQPAAMRVLELAVSLRRVSGDKPVIDELINRRYLEVTETHAASNPTIIDAVAFSDDADYDWLRSEVRRFHWLPGLVQVALAKWYREILDYLSHDLDEGVALLPLDALFTLVRMSLKNFGASTVSRPPWVNMLEDSVRRRLGDPDVDRQYDVGELDGSFVFLLWATTSPKTLDTDRLKAAWSVAASAFRKSRSSVALALYLLRSKRCAEHIEDAVALLYENRIYLSTERPQSAIDLSNLVRDTQPEKARELLELAVRHPQAAITLSRLIRRTEPDRSLALLEGVSLNPVAAMELATLICGKERRRAQELLERVSDHAPAAVQLSRLLRQTDPKRAREVLELAAADGNAAVELSRLIWATEPARAREILERVAREPSAAVELSRRLHDESQVRAQQLLESVSGAPTAAIELAKRFMNTDPDRARRILTPFASYQGAAIQLSRILRATDPEGAREVLERVSHDPNVAVELSRLLRHTDRAKAIEALERAAGDPTAARELSLLIRESDPERARNVLENAAADPHVAIELSRLIRNSDPQGARNVLERAPENPHVILELSRLIGETDEKQARELLRNGVDDPLLAMELARRLRDHDPEAACAVLAQWAHQFSPAFELAQLFSRRAQFDRAFDVLLGHARSRPEMALLLVRNAVGDDRLAVARSVLESHMDRTDRRNYVFRKLSARAWTSDVILRALPQGSGRLTEYFRYLWRSATGDAHATGLYSCLARGVFRQFLTSAKKLLLLHAAKDSYCAGELAYYHLSGDEAGDLRSWLRAMALAGNHRAAFTWATLTVKADDKKGTKEAIALIEELTEFTDDERQTYESLAARPRLEFTRMRDDVQPWRETTIWAAKRRLEV